MCINLFYTEDGVLVIAAALKPPQLLSTAPKETGKAFKQTLVTLQIVQPEGKTLCMVRRVVLPPELSESTAARDSMGCPSNVGAAWNSLGVTVQELGLLAPLGQVPVPRWWSSYLQGSNNHSCIPALRVVWKSGNCHQCRLPEGEGPVPVGALGVV